MFSARLRPPPYSMPAQIPAVSSAILSALRSHRWFASCPPDLQDALLAGSVNWRLAKGECLFERGYAPDGLCCVTSGAVQIGAVRPDGSQTLLAYLQPYQWFGEVSLLDGLPRTHDAMADQESTVLVVPQTVLHGWLDAHPHHWRDIARLACTKMRLLFAALEDIQHLPLLQRLARHLWVTLHAHGQAQHSARRSLKLSQEQLGQLLGTSRQRVNKSLSEMEEMGIIAVRYSQIDVLNLPGLERLAQGEDDPRSVPPGIGFPTASRAVAEGTESAE